MRNKYILLIFSLLLLTGVSFQANAQETTKRKKYGIIPDYINTQFAGNIGAGSVGAGYYLNKVRNFSFDFVYGYSPQYHTSVDLHNLVARFNYKPVTINLPKKWSLRPLVSMAVSVQIHDNGRTFTRLPHTYPEGYYSPTAFRFHLDLGGVVRYDFEPYTFIKALEFYITTTTNDLYVYYLFKTKHMTLFDAFSMAIGLNIFLFN